MAIFVYKGPQLNEGAGWTLYGKFIEEWHGFIGKMVDDPDNKVIVTIDVKKRTEGLFKEGKQLVANYLNESSDDFDKSDRKLFVSGSPPIKGENDPPMLFAVVDKKWDYSYYFTNKELQEWQDQEVTRQGT